MLSPATSRYIVKTLIGSNLCRSYPLVVTATATIAIRALASTTSSSSTTRRNSSSWVAPKFRGQRNQQQKQQQRSMERRPLLNGKAVAFHINDLKSSISSSIGSAGSICNVHNNYEAIRPLTWQPYHSQQSVPPKKKCYESDLVVVLDMDECLIHSTFLRNPQEAAIYAHQLRNQQQQPQPKDQFFEDGKGHDMVESFRLTLPDGELVHVHQRPGLMEFLQHVTSRYETHIFTAAMEVYAKPVLDHLCTQVRHNRRQNCQNTESSNKHEITKEPIFAGRWYREHCVYDPARSLYLKDLSKLALSGASRIVLVDNNPVSFLPNPENGILVNSFYQDNGDDTLSAVSTLLTDLETVTDVRPVLLERFQLPQAIRSGCPNEQQKATLFQYRKLGMDSQSTSISSALSGTTTTTSTTIGSNNNNNNNNNNSIDMVHHTSTTTATDQVRTTVLPSPTQPSGQPVACFA